jgi:putative transcriptional regulator
MRNQRNMTQEELADAVGVTRQTIIAIEKGNYAPSVFLALKCSSVLREPVEKIFKITK